MSPAGLVVLVLVWSGLVWAGASLICRMGPAPKLAQAIWRGAALVLLAPFVAAFFVPGFSVAIEAPLADLPMLEPVMIAPQDGAVVAAPARAIRLPEMGVLIICVIAAGWLVRFSLWGISQVRLQRLKARAMKTHRPIGHWAEAVGLSRTPQVHVIPRGAPFLAGILKRSIYVPAALIGGQGAQQVIVHELVHLKRGDLIARPLERIVTDLFWFSPFAWWIRGQLDFWREAVVDDETVELTGDRIAYARTLTSAARISRDEAVLPVAAFILRKKGNLKMRLNELLTEKPRPRRMGLVLAAALMCAAPLAVAQGMLIKGAAAAPGETLFYTHAVLDKATLTSAFGERVDPFTKKTATHRGVDLAAARGTPAYAPAAGTVIFAGEKEGYGNAVELMVSNDTVLRYGQLDTLSVEQGQLLKAGDEVGGVGTSGRSTGPHLHFEVWRDGELTDPQAEEGLVLADSLFITASSGAKAPAPPASSGEPAAPSEFAPPVAPAAPAITQEFIQQTYNGLQACEKVKEDFLKEPLPEDWVARRKVAREANRRAGLALDSADQDWTPEVIIWPTPVYPAELASARRVGVCRVLFDIGVDGEPENAIANCSDPAFEAAAAELPGARFKPATDVNGKPIEMKGATFPLQFCVK
ncbi:MAG: peptidoglycan DD-metalloendopeptidase family protein [Rhodobacterales bacterium]|nr:peptidoglycan DD-metalloendopeptidase family protein [Rhodobacterales bacterium]